MDPFCGPRADLFAGRKSGESPRMPTANGWGALRNFLVPGLRRSLQVCDRGSGRDTGGTRTQRPPGPNSPTVLLSLAIRFKPDAAGKTYRVEVAGRDDLGNEDPFTLAGMLTVN